MQIITAKNHKNALIALLSAEKLPVDDLADGLENFLIATKDGEVIGAIGLEIYGSYGLLRSLVVKPNFRKEGIAGELSSQIEKLSASKNLKSIYLLTETASNYFARKGYQKITRDDVPDEIKQSTEYSHVCPQSAIVMKKNIMKNILILCTGNSCRSQIAEGYMQHFAGKTAKVYSAGIETHGVNPKAIQAMAEDGIDISGHTSNNADEYLDIKFDYIITVCDNAHENCPYFPGKAERFHHNFPDPAKAQGSKEQIMDEFRQVRNMIKEYSKEFVTKELNEEIPS